MPATVAVMCCCLRARGADVAGTMIWVVGLVTALVVGRAGVREGVVDAGGMGGWSVRKTARFKRCFLSHAYKSAHWRRSTKEAEALGNCLRFCSPTTPSVSPRNLTPFRQGWARLKSPCCCMHGFPSVISFSPPSHNISGTRVNSWRHLRAADKGEVNLQGAHELVQSLAYENEHRVFSSLSAINAIPDWVFGPTSAVTIVTH